MFDCFITTSETIFPLDLFWWVFPDSNHRLTLSLFQRRYSAILQSRVYFPQVSVVPLCFFKLLRIWFYGFVVHQLIECASSRIFFPFVHAVEVIFFLLFSSAQILPHLITSLSLLLCFNSGFK